MGDFRVPYGFAWGKAENFRARTDNTLLQASTRPDITTGALWYSINTTTTTITHFDTFQAGVPIAPEGKEITIIFLDNSTSVANTDRLFLSSTQNTFATSSVLKLIHHNSAWYEVSRSKNTTNEVTALSLAGTITPNVDNVSVLLITPTIATTVLLSLSGGQPGQKLTVFHAGSVGVTMQVTTAGNIFIAGTNAFIMVPSAAYTLTKRDGTTWAMSSPWA